MEIKSGATFATDWLDSLRRWQALPGIDTCPPWVIYGGKQSHARETAELIG